MIIVFIVGYLAIAMEHITKVNKAAVALLITTCLWVRYALIAPYFALVPFHSLTYSMLEDMMWQVCKSTLLYKQQIAKLLKLLFLNFGN